MSEITYLFAAHLLYAGQKDGPDPVKGQGQATGDNHHVLLPAIPLFMLLS